MLFCRKVDNGNLLNDKRRGDIVAPAFLFAVYPVLCISQYLSRTYLLVLAYAVYPA